MTASTTTLQNYELIESIIAQMNPSTILLTAKRVSKSWTYMIQCSLRIQHDLSPLKPLKNHMPFANLHFNSSHTRFVRPIQLIPNEGIPPYSDSQNNRFNPLLHRIADTDDPTIIVHEMVERPDERAMEAFATHLPCSAIGLLTYNVYRKVEPDGSKKLNH
jgi:hypothetical protein